jgi:hypothetical protein
MAGFTNITEKLSYQIARKEVPFSISPQRGRGIRGERGAAFQSRMGSYSRAGARTLFGLMGRGKGETALFTFSFALYCRVLPGRRTDMTQWSLGCRASGYGRIGYAVYGMGAYTRRRALNVHLF